MLCAVRTPPSPSRSLHTYTNSVHRSLYDHAGILHRDISLSNVICGAIEGEVHGVLTNYDLSFWKATLTADHTKTSQQATGTTLHMAFELPKIVSTIHQYRHDVEFLFYVMLVMCRRHTIGYAGGKDIDARLQVMVREGKLPYRDWFERQGHTRVLLGIGRL